MERQVVEIPEFAEALGVHPATVRRLIDGGALRILRIASRVMIPRSELDRALSEGLPRRRRGGADHHAAKSGRAK